MYHDTLRAEDLVVVTHHQGSRLVYLPVQESECLVGCHLRTIDPCAVHRAYRYSPIIRVGAPGQAKGVQLVVLRLHLLVPSQPPCGHRACLLVPTATRCDDDLEVANVAP